MVLAGSQQLSYNSSSATGVTLRTGGRSATSSTAHLRSQPSPSNGHNNHDSDSDSSDSGDGNVVRVGHSYQAVVPNVDTVKPKPAPLDLSEHAVLVWSPYNALSEKELENYVNISKEKYNYNMEQALGMLCWHKFDLKKALADLPNFTPFPDEWSVEDKVLFEQAFQFHDKHFHKIRQMLPDKSIASLVKYYYSWKKTRSRTSLMDRQARKLKEDANKDDASENGSDPVSDEDMMTDDLKSSKIPDDPIDPRVDGNKPRCENCCTTATGQFHKSNKGLLCNTCYSFWQKTGTMKTKRPSDPSFTRHSLTKQKRKPPRGMYIDKDDLESLANGPPGTGETLLRSLDQEIVALKRQVQNNKQIISQTKHKVSIEINDDLQIPDMVSQRIVSRWTQQEELLAIQAFRKYGKDFQAIAEIVGNKNEAHIKSFYANNEKRLRLDKVIEDYESGHQSK